MDDPIIEGMSDVIAVPPVAEREQGFKELVHRRLASDLLLPRHVVSGPRTVAPLLDLKRRP